MPIMISNNWLLSYTTIAGINTILKQMSRRVKHTNNMDIACVDLEKYYKEFEQDFTIFFEELRVFSKHKITSSDLIYCSEVHLFQNSEDPSRLGVSEFMVRPVPPNFPNDKTDLFSHNSQTCPNSACLRLPDSQSLWILRFSDSQILRASVRTRLSI